MDFIKLGELLLGQFTFATAPLSANMHEKIILQLLNSIKVIGKD